MMHNWTQLNIPLADGSVAKVSYRGHGPLVLYIHGWAHSGHAWRRLQSTLSTPHAHVLLDLPGFGTAMSDRPSSPYIEYYAAFIRNTCIALKEHFGFPVVAVVAHSLGALACARAFSAECGSAICPDVLVLADVPFRGIWQLKPLLVFYPLIVAFAMVLKLIPRTVASALVRIAALPTTFKWSAMDDQFVTDCLASHPVTMANTLFAIVFASTDPLARPQTRHKLYLARGQRDWVMSRRVMRTFAEAWGGESHDFVGTTHTPHLEDTEQFDRWLGALIPVQPEASPHPQPALIP